MPLIEQVKFSQHWGGRLFPENFSDVRLWDVKFYAGAIHEIILNSNNLGTAEVMSVRFFNYRNIRDNVSYLISGQPSHYLAGMLCRFYNDGKVLPDDTQLVHVVYKWKNRNFEIQQYLLQEWWKDVTNTQVA